MSMIMRIRRKGTLIWIFSSSLAIAGTLVFIWRGTLFTAPRPPIPTEVRSESTLEWLHSFYIAGDSWMPGDPEVSFLTKVVMETGMAPQSESIEGDFRRSAAALSYLADGLERLKGPRSRSFKPAEVEARIAKIDDAMVMALDSNNPLIVTVTLGIMTESGIDARRPELDERIEPLAESEDRLTASMANKLLIKFQETWYQQHQPLNSAP